jgi:uncharacterized protein YndB with AHSA1/START domain
VTRPYDAPMATNAKQVSTERVIEAPPEKIFDVLADPNKHAVIDGSESIRRVASGPDRLGRGSKFGMSMRIGLPYHITNTVVEFEEGRLIGWCHFAKNVWRYELEPANGGTLVRETFDWSNGRFTPVLNVLNVAKKNLASMEKTLERLDRYVTTGAP